MTYNGEVKGWIVVRNWDRFQHRDAMRGKEHGAPPWIKNHLSLLSDDDYLGLSVHQRAVFHGLLLMYASAHGQLAVNTRSLTRRLGIRVSSVQLGSLNDAGFIQIVASKPPAMRQPRVEESRKETRAREPESSRSRPDKSGFAREGRGKKKTAYALAEAMTRNVGREYPQDSFRDELSKYELSDQEVAKLEDLWDELQEDPF